jgi:hypothetical protein
MKKEKKFWRRSRCEHSIRIFPKLNFGNSSFQNRITAPSFVKNFLFPCAFLPHPLLATNCSTSMGSLQNGTVVLLLNATSVIAQCCGTVYSFMTVFVLAQLRLIYLGRLPRKEFCTKIQAACLLHSSKLIRPSVVFQCRERVLQPSYSIHTANKLCEEYKKYY